MLGWGYLYLIHIDMHAFLVCQGRFSLTKQSHQRMNVVDVDDARREVESIAPQHQKKLFNRTEAHASIACVGSKGHDVFIRTLRLITPTDREHLSAKHEARRWKHHRRANGSLGFNITHKLNSPSIFRMSTCRLPQKVRTKYRVICGPWYLANTTRPSSFTNSTPPASCVINLSRKHFWCVRTREKFQHSSRRYCLVSITNYQPNYIIKNRGVGTKSPPSPFVTH